MDAEDRNATDDSGKSDEGESSYRWMYDWICFPLFPDYWSWALGAIITALVITVIAISPMQTLQPLPGNVVDESLKGVSAILPFPTCNIKESAKGEIEVSIRLFMHEHFLYTAVRVFAHFSSATNYRIMDQNSFKTDGDNSLFGEAINILHQRILIRRLNSSTHNLGTVLEHRDFEQLDKHKCVCSSALSDWSFISLKFITFDADKSLPAEKVAHIKKNSSFDVSTISAISKTGIINATKFTTFTIKNLNCPVALQVTEIVKLIPPSRERSTTSDKMDPTLVDKIMCWTGANSETCQFKDAVEPGPDNCRHVTVLVKNVEDRYIPETIISAFFCH